MSREAELAIQIYGAIGVVLKAPVYHQRSMLMDVQEKACELYKILESKDK